MRIKGFMDIKCEVPDDIGQIWGEFLPIADLSDDDVAKCVFLFLNGAVITKLKKQWFELQGEIEKSQDGEKKKEQQEEVMDKIAKLIVFGSSWTQNWAERYAKAKGKEAEKQKKKRDHRSKRRWEKCF